MTAATTRRKFIAISAAVLFGLTSTVTACGKASGGGPGAAQTKTLRYQGSVGTVTPAELAADLGYLEDVKLEWVGNTISGPQDIQSAATGQTDFGGAFNGAVVKLAAAGAPIKAVIGYYGSDEHAYSGFYVLEDSPIRSPRDLFGKKVGMNTLGAHHEAILGTYLQRNGVSNEEVKQVEPLVVPPVNTEQSLRQKQIDVAVLGGILRDKALKAGGIRPLFSDFDLLGPFTAGTIIFTKRFIEQNPDTVRTFVTGVGKAIKWTKETPREQVIARMTEIVKKRNRNEDVSTLQYWKSYGVANPTGLVDEKEISVWVDWLTNRNEIKPGQVKATDIFTNEFNASPKAGA